MIRLALALVLAADGGFAPQVWVTTGADGGTEVCMDSATSIRLAQHATAAEVERDELAAKLAKTDPEWVTMLVWVLAGVATGVGGGLGVACATGHCR